MHSIHLRAVDFPALCSCQAQHNAQRRVHDVWVVQDVHGGN